MSMLPAESFLANAYRMRFEAAKYLAEAREENASEEISDWKKLLKKTEDLVRQAEYRFGVPHRALPPAE